LRETAIDDAAHDKRRMDRSHVTVKRSRVTTNYRSGVAIDRSRAGFRINARDVGRGRRGRVYLNLREILHKTAIKPAAISRYIRKCKESETERERERERGEGEGEELDRMTELTSRFRRGMEFRANARFFD